MTSTPATQRDKIDEIERFSGKVRERFAAVLSANPLGIEPFVMGVRSALMGNEKLAEVALKNPASLFTALAEAAALGLSPDPQLEHFYPIPYGKEVQAQVGYRGLMFLAEQTGQIDDIGAMVIYREEFERLREEGLRVVDRQTGEINLDEEDRILGGVCTKDEDIVAAVAWVRLKGRPKQLTQLMTRDQIEQRRKAGHGNTPAWKQWYPEQCRKTVIKALLRSGRVPLGAHHRKIMAAIESEDGTEVFRGERADFEERHVLGAGQAEVKRLNPVKPIEDRDHERRELDPLPSDEDRRAELTADIWEMADRADIDTDTVHAWCVDRHGADIETASLDALADVRRALEAGELLPGAAAKVQGMFAAEGDA